MKPAGRHQHVQMGIEIEKPAEGLLHYDEKHASSVFALRPTPDNRCADSGQVVEQIAIPLKQRPEKTRDREIDSYITNVWERIVQLRLPQRRRSVSATWAHPRLASVRNEQPLGFRRVDFSS